MRMLNGTERMEPKQKALSVYSPEEGLECQVSSLLSTELDTSLPGRQGPPFQTENTVTYFAGLSEATIIERLHRQSLCLK